LFFIWQSAIEKKIVKEQNSDEAKKNVTKKKAKEEETEIMIT
jgi:hypothetical protein